MNRKITPRSCLSYMRRGFRSNGFYRIYDFKANIFMTVYCDMNSEPGTAWTLITSFALKNAQNDKVKKHPLQINAPVNEKSPNWNIYRMSLSQMTYLKSQSTHWRATCSFPTHGVDYTDYVRAKFADFDIMTFLGDGICKKVEYINIRDHSCAQCTSKWWQVRNTYAPHVDSTRTNCELNARHGSNTGGGGEDNFGFYDVVNSKFRCTSGPSSTTNWWFGGYQ